MVRSTKQAKVKMNRVRGNSTLAEGEQLGLVVDECEVAEAKN